MPIIFNIQQGNSLRTETVILGFKGGFDAPKVFNRFKYTDSTERMNTYLAEEEAFDAICFIPKKDIKFAGFSVYAVFGSESPTFTCIYKLKIGQMCLEKS